MNNRTIKITAVLVALVSVLSVFAACSRNKTEEAEMLYKKGGKLYYRQTPQDDAHELATDANGVTVVDANGNLIWNITDKSGNSYTHPVSYPSYLQEGRVVSCQQFSIKIPSGWKNIGNNAIMLRDPDKQRQIDYSFYGPEEDGTVHTAASQTAEIEEFMKDAVAKGEITLKKEKVQIGGRDAAKLIIIGATEEKKSYLEAFYVETPSGLLAFSCTCKYEEGGKFDFKAILDTIEYRV